MYLASTKQPASNTSLHTTRTSERKRTREREKEKTREKRERKREGAEVRMNGYSRVFKRIAEQVLNVCSLALRRRLHHVARPLIGSVFVDSVLVWCAREKRGKHRQNQEHDVAGGTLSARLDWKQEIR
jgi:hypothetical protein